MKIQGIGAQDYKYRPRASKENGLSFGRTTAEHRSWGAYVDPNTKDVSFKVLVYKFIKDVGVRIYPQNSDEAIEIKLEDKGDGVFEKRNIPSSIVKDGDKYQYVLHRDDKTEKIKDPYSFKQEIWEGPSTVYDQSKYRWRYDRFWKNDYNRILRTDEYCRKKVRQARIYALSPDCFTDERSYNGVISGLKNIKRMGFNAVEIMHIENTYSYNWGYDGVDKHAPSNYLGGPDALKQLVDEAHKVGLNVIFDIVPNHIGPDGNQLGISGPYTDGEGPFGSRFNYENVCNEHVRDFMINAAINWIEHYHVDGLRLDMTSQMCSDYTLKQMASEIHYHYPECFLIAEDGRGGVSIDEFGNPQGNPNEIHDKRIVRPISPDDYGENQDEAVHSALIQKIADNNTDLAALGMDSEWDFNFHHKLDGAMYYPNSGDLIWAMLCAQDGVKYVASHDEIGNYDGTRKISKYMMSKLKLNEHIKLSPEERTRAFKLSPIKCTNDEQYFSILRPVQAQRAQVSANELAKKYQSGKLEKYKITPDMPWHETNRIQKEWEEEVLIPLEINPKSGITYDDVAKAFNSSAKQCKMAMALTYAVPGPKMVFQGDEKLDLTPFKFFRKFKSAPSEDNLKLEKGYDTGMPALEESTLGHIEYDEAGKARMEKYGQLSFDLNKINEENNSLSTGYIQENTIVNNQDAGVFGFCTKEKSNEIFTVCNLKETNYREDENGKYRIKFPRGTWVEILNTDDTKYGGTSKHANYRSMYSNGNTEIPINLAGYSTIYFKRVVV